MKSLNVAGIYCILNLENQRHYIGSASDIDGRWRRHRFELRANKHHNAKLQNTYNKYGEEVFRFDLLEIVADKTTLQEREQFWMDNTNPFYNILRNARSARGYKHSDESKRKMGIKSKLRWDSMSTEERIKVGKAHAEKLIGRKMSEENKSAISNALSGKMPHKNSLNNLTLMSEKNRAILIDKNSKVWNLIDPSGIEHEVKNLAKFCRENTLIQGKMVLVAQGHRKTHKGWTCSYSQDIPRRH